MKNKTNKFYLLEINSLHLRCILRQPRFTSCSCRPFTNDQTRIQKFIETGNFRHIYKNEVNNTHFQHDMVYGNFKNLPRRPACDKVLQNRIFKIASNSKYDGHLGRINIAYISGL